MGLSLVALTSCQKETVSPQQGNASNTTTKEFTLTKADGSTILIPATVTFGKVSSTQTLKALAKKIPIKVSGNGWAIEGWVNDDCSHGDLVIMAGGNYYHIVWKVAPGASNNMPDYYTNYEQAVLNQESFDANFGTYHEFTLTDASTNEPTTFEAIGRTPSDVIFPIWEETLKQQ